MNSYFLLALFAFWANVPLGYFRENTKKFSFAWFFFVHASIPFIILLRLKMHISPWFIPVSIFAAILGQLTGSRLRKINPQALFNKGDKARRTDAY